jgi:diguanylate cyclase (GGDEF)-like protein
MEDWEERGARAACDLPGLGVVLFDQQFIIRWISPRVEQLIGPASRLIGASGIDFVHPDELAFVADLLSHHSERSDEYEHIRADGTDERMLGASLRMADPSGGWTQRFVSIDNRYSDGAVNALVCVIQRSMDATALFDSLDLIATGVSVERVLARILDHVAVENGRGMASLVYDLDGRRVEARGIHREFAEQLLPTTLDCFGRGDPSSLSVDELRAHGLVELSSAAEALGFRMLWLIPITHASTDGAAAYFAVWTPLDYALVIRPSMNVAVGTKVAALALAEHRRRDDLHRDTRRDPLTGLANRRALSDAAEQWAHGHGGEVSVLSIDLDRFKPVNDRWGHGAGDIVLCCIGRRLESVTRANDVVIRLGGDEFVVVCPGVSGGAVLEALANRVREAIAQPIDIGDAEVVVTATVVTSSRAPGETLDEVVAAADAQLCERKRGALR